MIFGIFTLTSYLIFQDSLRPKLTTIFTESFSPSSLHTNEWIMSNSLESRMSKVLFKEGVYEIIYDSNIEVNNLGDKSPAGLRPVLNDINIPFGYKIDWEMEVYSKIDFTFSIDFLALPSKSFQAFGGVPIYNQFGTTNCLDGYLFNSTNKTLLSKNKWHLITLTMSNDNLLNTEEISINERTSFGMSYKDFKKTDSYFMKNVKYRISKI